MFGISPAEFEWGVNSRESFSTRAMRSCRRLSDSWSETDMTKHYGQKTVLFGDVFVMKVESLDTALWKMGGAAVSLTLVDLAEVNYLYFSFGWLFEFLCPDSTRTVTNYSNSYR